MITPNHTKAMIERDYPNQCLIAKPVRKSVDDCQPRVLRFAELANKERLDAYRRRRGW
ncbi:hypothetical protein LMG33810_000935 [Carnimonas sp. LMG 33810]